MSAGPRDRLRSLVARARRLERRELRQFRTWLGNTQNLLHLTVLLVVPLIVGTVTALSNAVQALPFLLFPPIASGTYALFANPESKYASPVKFVAGLTVGAICGTIALEVASQFWFQVPKATFRINAGAAAFSLFLTASLTWLLDVEEPQAFSTSLLVLGTDLTPDLGPAVYALSVFVSSAFVATVFTVWRREFYEQRARYLYSSTRGDDHVLVPMWDDNVATATLGARLAGAHDAGKVVLLDVVDEEALAAAERHVDETESGADRPSTADDPDDDDTDAAERQVADERATRLERRAREIETKVGVPCEVAVVADGSDRAATVARTAEQTNCNLVVVPYAEQRGRLSPFVRRLFRGDLDVLVHRSTDGRTRWRNVLVPVRRGGDVAHAMLDFAYRLTGDAGRIAVCHCLGGASGRRRAESMLADIAETVAGNVETRVVSDDVESFLTWEAPHFDLVIIGASTDRTAASRFVSPPTFERITELDADVAILDRNSPL